MFRTLRGRYLLASLSALTVMLALFMWNGHHHMQRTLQERFDDERRTLAPLLGAALGPLLATRDYAAIGELVGTLAASRGIEFIELVDSRGRPVARAGSAPAPDHPIAIEPVLLAQQSLGEVRFTLRTESLRAAQRQLALRGLAIGAAALLAGAVLLVLAARWLGREFQGLSQASRRIADGEYDTRLPGSSVREIDEVAGAFNRMAEAVAAQLQALRNEQQFMRGVLDTLAEGYLIVDTDNRVIDCNDAFLRLHGLERKPEGGFNPGGTRLFLPDGSALAEDERATLQVLRSGQPLRDRLLRIERGDGSSRWVTVNASPLFRGETRPYAAMATLTDVTRHVQAELELRSTNETLEQRVRERTAELHRAKEEAEAANRGKSEFLSRMSHELRTPLNAILGFAQLMAMDRALPEAERARLRQIEAAGWHLLALINDVLDLSRIESGVMSSSPEAVDLNAAVAEALALVQVQATRRHITLAAPPSGTAWVEADRRHLKQVLANLLSNAVKYNREGGRVEVRVGAPVGGQRPLEVVDTGRGLAPGELARLFQPFTRFQREGDAIEGTGIGLVITRRLVELMRGRVEVASEVDRGSTFRVWLPVGAAPEVMGAAEPSEPAPPAERRTPPRRLLYVEDNPSNVELLRQILRLRPDWQLEVAVDGPSGLERLRREAFDIALVDIDLPGLDGLELCRRLRAGEHNARLPLLALSANAMPLDQRRAREAGFDGYLTKPVNVALLLERLDHQLEVT